ncbi:MAG: methyltransferase domain-containing protein [Chitinivibrionales bacterium]|nr:methyltransferase domain-containing protein [Chitinivibrionales bacterium]
MVYSALAPIYDRVMSHVEYGEWVQLIRRVIDRHARLPTSSIFEIGAGTGVLGERLRTEGYEYIGSDLSYAMCREGRRRIPRYLCADGRALPLKQRFDLVLFLYDGINYLGSRADYDTLFRQVHGVLRSEGLFLFDVTTEANSRRYFSDFYDCEDFGDSAYIRHSYYDEIAGIQHNEFAVFHREPGTGLFRRSDEHHAQRVLPSTTIQAWVPEELFDIVGIWDGYGFRRHSRSSERIHFLLRARQAP